MIKLGSDEQSDKILKFSGSQYHYLKPKVNFTGKATFALRLNLGFGEQILIG